MSFLQISTPSQSNHCHCRQTNVNVLLVDGGADPGSFRKDFASGGEEVRLGQIVRTAEPDEGKPVLGQASLVQLAIDHGGKIGQRISAKIIIVKYKNVSS
jgi:hypothetical protein